MFSIAFIDTEIEPNSCKILDIGSVKDNGSEFHSTNISGFVTFLSGTKFICGHNILNHDIKYIKNAIEDAGINESNIIDTLYLSALLFPAKPYHKLVKDDKLQTEDTNNPLNDSIKAKDLFYDEVTTFNETDGELKQIFYGLLSERREFQAFFDLIQFRSKSTDLRSAISKKFKNEICSHADLSNLISDHPIELAYCLSLINCKNRHSITPPWILKNFPNVEQIMHRLRNKPCLTGCTYCDKALDIHIGLKKFFNYDSYKTFEGEPLQEKAVKAAVENKSLLAVFPTGGGKSLTFQVPALMSGETTKGLTVVISPLQSLMKDQVDNLEKIGVTEAVTINGLLDPIERAKSFERVEDGTASILYISPESLRSRSIERLLLGRKVVRFVIDEAHCFSSWGQDFRVDYQYIGDFIKNLQNQKKLADPIPVSCFTATAKQKVVEDICTYFQDKLSLDLEIFRTSSSRANLKYKVTEYGSKEEKYNAVRNLLDIKLCPTIIYVSRTKTAYDLAKRLSEDGYSARPYHGKMDVDEKTQNQDAFINGEISIMVATSAFGMGVDKKDVEMVIHYEISDSLENYVQEAGRAGRDENISAECHILYNEEDLSKHFILLNQTKLHIKEIQQVWKAIKSLTKFRSSVSNSALEIARRAGWDDNVVDIESRVTTAIAALENAGYIKRGQNMPRIFANSIMSKNAQEAIDKINGSIRFEESQKVKAIRIIKKLFSSKSKRQSNEEVAESRVDYISDHLGIVKEEVIRIINLLREEKILADAKDLTAFIQKGEKSNRSLKIVDTFGLIENYLLSLFDEEEKTFHLKELNENAESDGCKDVSPNKIKTILNFWATKNWIKRRYEDYSRNHASIVCIQPRETLKSKLEKRHQLARFIIEFLYDKTTPELQEGENSKQEVLVEFSVHELKEAFENSIHMFETEASIDDIEDTLFYLSRIEAIKIEGGFLVVYNRITLEREEKDNKRNYKKDDYYDLSQFYNNKVQQIHIVGEYAKRMIDDYKGALQFVDDYFQLNYLSFLNKYFPGSRKNEIRQNLTPKKFKELFLDLSARQLDIIKDHESKNIAVLAGPGSGKTKLLVHKLASLLMMEDVKHEQLLMLTFSRAAATEFKKRLIKLIGNAANFIEIKTFHSYCFDLLGRVGSLEKSGEIIRKTVQKIENNDVEQNRITKTVLVIDEAQDIDQDEFALIRTLMSRNEEMRVIAVGDDDQNIFEFRGASSRYLEIFISELKATKHELVENFRSKRNLVEFTNNYAKTIQHRLKESPLIANSSEDGYLTIIKYNSDNLIIPVVNDILKRELIGTICVLTKTNDEALQVAGVLQLNGVPSKLIQSNDAFSLNNLQEIRFFIDQLNLDDSTHVINDDKWRNAKRQLVNSFSQNINLELIKHIIRDFEHINSKKKYKSDLEVFLKESRLEDFYSNKSDIVYISTIHKAKGKEFDNVFLLLDRYSAHKDEDKRSLYVAMTRAKNNLFVHLNRNYQDNIQSSDVEWKEDLKEYSQPQMLTIQLSHKDLWLDYFIDKQRVIEKLKSGDDLVILQDLCADKNRNPVLKFSKSFIDRIAHLEKIGFKLMKAKVNFNVYWNKDGLPHDILIVLPELTFKKYDNTIEI